ncbi:MAG: HNH endonuclease [Candidatus Margulisbacteria bacterium]|nr:HNH endonuclease [Candidatus Margulisiibacteriota bacterium]
MAGNVNKDWSKEELAAAIDAYLFMLNKESSKAPFNKAEIRRNLQSGILKNRTESSIEFRMQNISAVMEALCLPRISGYLPAKNIGSNVFNKIKKILEDRKYIDPTKYEPTEDNDDYNTRASFLIKNIHPGKPVGVQYPEKVAQNTTVFKRDPLIKAWILNNADGICEKCKKNGPFIKDDNTSYLEVHHIKSLSDGGSDTIENTVALCPNCHRELHFSINKISLLKDLIKNIRRLKIP